jgi:hypothetical protein
MDHVAVLAAHDALIGRTPFGKALPALQRRDDDGSRKVRGNLKRAERSRRRRPVLSVNRK